MARFSIRDTSLNGLHVVQRRKVEDSRGFFSRFFCADEIATAGFLRPISQINHTLTKRRGSVRGMHFQFPPHSEDKFVSCLRGEVFDVAVDLRKDSPTFLQWHAEILTADNDRSLLIPQGFAHGFQTLVDDVELLYLHSVPYAQSAEGGLSPTDPKLAIAWPLELTELSPRDAAHPHLTNDFDGI
ncbi:dTDP-4-dehydrorhamnose 3,5-epimerase [Variovorax paradoxus]|uniref:dTDP-4-dehydrorhamnose 3,5-epimerase family protein n=1 Tax=Variovorax paradoxus TaxID=34073 RepID=UPI00278E1DB2|nr:dTDP-4-dehydrorhamnose 3,5-epimerase family protein [Variovorax paradoxus]MDQ0572436.1 dTDP-4-dehydrorhamnose 3,5-epimerase [Variovorax paradoxus]